MAGIKLGLSAVDLACGVEGCRDTYSIIIASTTKRERRQDIERGQAKREAEGTNFCLRHKNPDKVITPHRRHKEITAVVVNRGRNGREEKALVPADDPVNGSAIHQTIGPDSAWYLYLDELPYNARVTFSIDVEIPEGDGE